VRNERFEKFCMELMKNNGKDDDDYDDDDHDDGYGDDDNDDDKWAIHKIHHACDREGSVKIMCDVNVIYIFIY